jgi:hypothetical protein
MQKIKRGKSFRGVLNYALASGPVIGGNMIGLTTPRELAREFGQARRLREDIKKPVWHNSLRLQKGERIEPERFAEIADDYMRKMGFNDLHQRVYIMHDHPDGQHIHIIANRIGVDRQIYFGQNENLKSTKIIAGLERQHSLTISPDNKLEKNNDSRKFYKHVPKPHPGNLGRTAKNGMRRLSTCNLAYSGKGEKSAGVLQIDVRPGRRLVEHVRWAEPTRRRPTAGEVGMAERTGALPARMRLQTIIDEASADRPDFAEFTARLDAAGVLILPSGKTGAPQGVSFEMSMSGQRYKGSDLGKSYTWKQLQARVDYDPDRDQLIIDRLRAQAINDAENDQTNEISPGASPVPQPNAPRRTLDLAFERHGAQWLWKDRERAAFIDNGDRISIVSQNETAIRGALQLARQKWGTEINVTGSDNYRRRVWLISNETGLTVTGYEPSQADRDELQRRLDEKQRLTNERKNSRNAGSSTDRSPEQNQNSSGAVGVDRAPGNGADQPDRGDTGQPDREPGSSGGYTGSGRTSFEIQTTAIRADNPRSADLAGLAVVADHRDSVGSIIERVNNVESLAAPISETGHDKPANRLEQPNAARPRDHEAKVNAWRAQHEALGSPHYRITFVDRDPERIKKHGRMGLGYVLGKTKGTDIKTPAEVEAAISTLRRDNARGFDVYLTPIDEKNHYVLIDDIHEDKAGKLAKFKADGFNPVLLQYSSADNYQAILKIPKIDGDHDFANQIFQKLNTDYGEPGIKGGVVHAFRMCGFSNRKPGRNSEFTRLIETNPGAICGKTSELIKFAMESHDEEKKNKAIEKERNRRLRAIENHNQTPLNPGGNDAVLRAYKKSFNRTLGLAKKQGWNIDLSRIDFAATKDLIKQGYRAELIENAIAEGSPNIELRKGQHMADYARLTVQKAMVSNDVIQHKARAEAQQAQRSGPKPGL